MLKKIQAKSIPPQGGRFALVASLFNQRYVDSMLAAARSVFKRARVDALEVFRVPGAFEIPVVAARLVRLRPPVFDAVLCFGVIFRGETTHAQHIGEAVSLSLAHLQTTHAVPVIHGVYLFENQDQARVRCLDPEHNRGRELAQTALSMAALMRQLDVRWRIQS
jgi:6,7-dimethyl-8-ribityllumazine synthase